MIYKEKQCIFTFVKLEPWYVLPWKLLPINFLSLCHLINQLINSAANFNLENNCSEQYFPPKYSGVEVGSDLVNIAFEFEATFRSVAVFELIVDDLNKLLLYP